MRATGSTIQPYIQKLKEELQNKLSRQSLPTSNIKDEMSLVALQKLPTETIGELLHFIPRSQFIHSSLLTFMSFLGRALGQLLCIFLDRVFMHFL